MAMLHKFVTWGFGNLGVVLSESDPVSYVFVFQGDTSALLEDEVYIKTLNPDLDNSVLYDFLTSEQVTMADNVSPIKTEILSQPSDVATVTRLMETLRGSFADDSSSEDLWEESSSSEDDY